MLPLQILFQQQEASGNRIVLNSRQRHSCEETLSAELRDHGFATGIWNVWVLTGHAKCSSKFRAQAIDRDSRPGKETLKAIVRCGDDGFMVLIEPPSGISVETVLLRLQGKEKPPADDNPPIEGAISEPEPELEYNPDKLVACQNYVGLITSVKSFGVFVMLANGGALEHLCHISELTNKPVLPKYSQASDAQWVKAIRDAGFKEGKQVKFKALGPSKDQMKNRGKWNISIKAIAEKKQTGISGLIGHITADGTLTSVSGWFDDPELVQETCLILIELLWDSGVGYIPKDDLHQGLIRGLNKALGKLIGGITIRKIKGGGVLTRMAGSARYLCKYIPEGETEPTGYLPTDLAYLEADMPPDEDAPRAEVIMEINPIPQLNVDLELAEAYKEKRERLMEIDQTIDAAGLTDLILERQQVRAWLARNPRAREQYEKASNGEVAGRFDKLREGRAKILEE